MREISQSDWKTLRKLHPIALDRYCQAVLTEIGKLSCATAQSPHRRYLDVYQLIKKRDAEMGRIFNELRKSQAFLCIAVLKSHGLLTEEEFSGFSEELRNGIALLNG